MHLDIDAAATLTSKSQKSAANKRDVIELKPALDENAAELSIAWLPVECAQYSTELASELAQLDSQHIALKQPSILGSKPTGLGRYEPQSVVAPAHSVELSSSNSLLDEFFLVSSGLSSELAAICLEYRS